MTLVRYEILESAEGKKKTATGKSEDFFPLPFLLSLVQLGGGYSRAGTQG
ncbi:MAG: hypothetical protein HOK71_06325 [Planctomycetaceae bacterium]|nr:hypothetical protein [Planctomycetaceae bacterium]MBT6484268.1 hypothetical protein [Planctomycetaceae bacterium]